VVVIGPAEAGIHLLAGLPYGADDVAIAHNAEQLGIELTPLSPHYYSTSPRQGMLLGFGALPEEQLARGIQLLAPLVRAAVPSSSKACRS
jgi:GntR family transcriptional regulator/MocR family aminotransferase